MTATVMARADWVGNSVVDRPIVDLANGIDIVDLLHPISVTGVVSEWSLFARATGDVSLRIYRPLGGINYKIIGENAVNATATGVNNFAIDPSQRISVLSGDLIGFHYGGSFGTKVIAYADGGGTVGVSNWPITDAGVGGTVDLVSQSSRTYSLAADVQAVPEPASLLLLTAGSAFLIRRRSR